MAFCSEATVCYIMAANAMRPALGFNPPYKVRFVFSIFGVIFERTCSSYLAFFPEVLHLVFQVGNLLGERRDFGILCGEVVHVLRNLFIKSGILVVEVCHHHTFLWGFLGDVGEFLLDTHHAVRYIATPVRRFLRLSEVILCLNKVDLGL